VSCNPHAWIRVYRAYLGRQTSTSRRAPGATRRGEPMSVIPEESGRETTDMSDNGLGFMMVVLIALAVVTALFT